ncbi:MAG: hypothetical protein GX207_01070 [Peptococcaceae bacterium]|nr:hypothetical protein [Peptococcaceae bacterium]
MRKYLRDKIIDLFATLEEAHKEIGEYIQAGEIDTAISLMAQCQEGATAIGNTIEETESEGTRTVEYLEEYYKLLFVLSESLEIGQKCDFSQLNKELYKIRNSFDHEVKAKIEIAFFPYKASMWDSLESVWLAAKDDDRCECYVVPIPYFDRNKDGSLGTMHYEGDQFPSYVPITDWQSYNPAVMLPDIAYIHNPYDQFNLVTSVHPAFYSSELKKYTNQLVYIPYYSTSGDMSQGQSSLPAYQNVDKIIIQSEWHRKFFESTLPLERLLPLGSPKFDRIIRMAREKPELPSEWRKKMSGKTVYFFNTSLAGLLSNTEVYLRKMEYVFNCFQGRENALLLWRPHPLMEATLDSMRPQYKKHYMELKERFIVSGLGIYDDTSDISASVAWSDVYIGDSGTSVTSLFAIAGKPQFILNNNLNKEPEPDDLTTLALSYKMYLEGNNAWLVSYYSWLVKLNLESGRLDPICQLTDMTMGRYADVLKIGSRIFVGPTHAQDICIVENGELRKIALEKFNQRTHSFVKMVQYKHYLYLIPGRYPALVRFNTETEGLTYYFECLKEFTGAQDGIMFQQGVCIRGQFLYMASAFDNRVLIFDMESGKYRIKAVGQNVGRGCWSMEDDGEDFWILPINGSVITRWNPVTDEVREYSNYPENFFCRNFEHGFVCQDRPFSAAVCFDDYVLLVPLWSNMFIKIDKLTGEMSQWDPPFKLPQEPKNCYYKNYSSFGFTAKIGSKSFITFCYYNRVLYAIDMEKNECTQHQYQINLEFRYVDEYGFNYVSEWLQYACLENDINTLPAFLDGKIVGKPFDSRRQLELYSRISANIDGTCGEKVHNLMVEEVIAKAGGVRWLQ